MTGDLNPHHHHPDESSAWELLDEYAASERAFRDEALAEDPEFDYPGFDAGSIALQLGDLLDAHATSESLDPDWWLEGHALASLRIAALRVGDQAIRRRYPDLFEGVQE